MKRHSIPHSESLGNGQGVSDPVHLWVSFLEPEHSQNDLFLSETQYHELDIFPMGWEPDLDIHFPFNVSLGVGGFVHIIGFDWSLETLCYASRQTCV